MLWCLEWIASTLCMGDTLLETSTHYRYYECGFLLAEWIIGIAIVLCIVIVGASMIVQEPSRHELNCYTKEVLYSIKKVQLWSMLGHSDERMRHSEFILKKHSYYIKDGSSISKEEVVFPDYIESRHFIRRVYFSAYGLPYDSTEFVLQDTRTGLKNRIWISVQTGRIRWEPM